MKSHFVPRMYLREFIDPFTPTDQEPWLWFADFETSKVGRRSVENFGRLANYYAFKDEAGKENQELEKMLGKTESFSRAIFDTLRTRPSAFSSDDRVKLCVFVALLQTRVPSSRNYFEFIAGDLARQSVQPIATDPAKFEAALNDAVKGHELSATEIEQLRLEALDDRTYDFQVSPEWSLQAMVEVGQMFSSILLQMNWAMLKPAAGVTFWSSDNPVVWLNPATWWKRGISYHTLLQDDVEITFPLNPKLCLLASRKGPAGFYVVPNLMVSIMNHRQMMFADRYVIANNEGAVREAVSLRRPAPP